MSFTRHPHIKRAGARGFTLIELMTTCAVGLIVATTISAVMYQQSVTFVERLQEADAHQNARAAMNILRRYVRAARFGMPAATTNVNTSVQPIGTCYATNAPNIVSQMNCAGVDLTGPVGNANTADRMRVAFMVDDSAFVFGQATGSGADCTAGTRVTAVPNNQYIHVVTTPIGLTFQPGDLVAMGGTCANNTNLSAIDFLTYQSDVGHTDNCPHGYIAQLTALTPSSTNACGDASIANTFPSAYQSNFSFGHAVIADFFVNYDTTTSAPILKMRTNPTQPIANAYPVAYDVETFNVTYYVQYDVNNPSSTAFTHMFAACPGDPRSPSDGGTCVVPDITNNNNPMTTANIYNRIVGVQMTIGIRTDRALRGPYGFINVGPKANQGYLHYTYTTYVQLRNNVLL